MNRKSAKAKIFFSCVFMLLAFQNCNSFRSGNGGVSGKTANSTNLSSTQSACGSLSGAEPSGDFDIIIVAGQSNAVGSGEGDDFDDPSLNSQDGHLFQIARYGECNGLVIPANPSLQFRLVGPSWSLKGIAIPFARRYASQYLSNGRNVLLIPAAQGSTSIVHWANHVLSNDPDPIDLYNDMMMRTKFGLAYPRSRVVAVLWNQGEGDISVLDLTDPVARANAATYYSVIPNGMAYAGLVKKMINQMRADLPQSACVPFLIGESVPAWRDDLPLSAAVKADFRSAQISIAQSLKCVAYVESTGLTSNTEDFPTDAGAAAENKIHYSARSAAAYGSRYFTSFNAIQTANSNTNADPSKIQNYIQTEYQLIFNTPATPDTLSYLMNSYSSGQAGCYAIVRDLLSFDPLRSQAAINDANFNSANQKYISKLYSVAFRRNPIVSGDGSGDNPQGLLVERLSNSINLNGLDAIFLSHPEFENICKSSGMRLYPSP